MVLSHICIFPYENTYFVNRTPQDDVLLEDLRNGPGGVGQRKTSESMIWRCFLQRFPAPSANQKITGSDLCFSIRSVLLVEEPGGDRGGERGPGGEEGFHIEPGSERLDFHVCLYNH